MPDSSKPVRIAAWSGPRNISTAMMRSFENRDDCFVCDEPFYAHYLIDHGFDHPVREKIIEHHQPDPHKVIAWLTGEIPNGKSVFYQKVMTHHMIKTVPRDWLTRVTNVFLIREPKEMLTSLIKVLPAAKLLDTGLPQQVELFEQVFDQTGEAPTVLDSRDVLEDPRAMLTALCERVGIEFQESMLHWPKGRRDTDGVWAPYWYASVEDSTGFAPYRPKNEDVPPEFEETYQRCVELYQKLAAVRLRPKLET
jgi:hypothetical protein